MGRLRRLLGILHLQLPDGIPGFMVVPRWIPEDRGEDEPEGAEAEEGSGGEEQGTKWRLCRLRTLTETGKKARTKRDDCEWRYWLSFLRCDAMRCRSLSYLPMECNYNYNVISINDHPSPGVTSLVASSTPPPIYLALAR